MVDFRTAKPKKGNASQNMCKELFIRFVAPHDLKEHDNTDALDVDTGSSNIFSAGCFVK